MSVTKFSAKELLERSGMILSGGAFDALSAKMIEVTGFDAIYTSGSGITGSLMGLPDAGFLDRTQNLEVTRHMVRSVDIPIVADIDTGYGDVASVVRTIQDFEMIGAAGVVLEDQVSPKICPQLPRLNAEIPVVSIEEAEAKVRAAVEARNDKGFVILARTDSAGDEVYRRAEAFARAGADMVLPITSAFQNVDEYLVFIQNAPLPVCVNVSGWLSLNLTIQELTDAGCKWANFPTVPRLAALSGMRDALSRIIETRDVKSVVEAVYPFSDYEGLIGADELVKLQLRYAGATPSISTND